MKVFLLVLCLLTGGALLSVAQAEDSPGKSNPYTGNPEAIEEGAKLYKRLNCYACHGAAGGGGMGPSLSDDQWQQGNGDDSSLLTQVLEGRAAMPAYGAVIGEDDAWKVIAFVRTLYKGDPERVTW